MEKKLPLDFSDIRKKKDNVIHIWTLQAVFKEKLRNLQIVHNHVKDEILFFKKNDFENIHLIWQSLWKWIFDFF